MEPNPEAIAWYLQRSEDLLDELRRRVESLHSRGGQIAGFSGAVLALGGTNAEPILAALHGAARTLAGGSLLVGCLLLVAALMKGLSGALMPQVATELSAREVANYATDRFIGEPDLWRVHLRTIRGLTASIEAMTRLDDRTARSIGIAQRFFFAGLSLVGGALAILILVVTF